MKYVSIDRCCVCLCVCVCVCIVVFVYCVLGRERDRETSAVGISQSPRQYNSHNLLCSFHQGAVFFIVVNQGLVFFVSDQHNRVLPIVNSMAGVIVVIVITIGNSSRRRDSSI